MILLHPGSPSSRCCRCRSSSGPRAATTAPRPSLQEVQQRVGELTVEAEEAVSGVRVVRAFAREDRMRDRFRPGLERVFDQNVYATRLRAFYNPLIGFLPTIGLAVVLLVGGRQVIDGTITIGEFTAFYAYLIMLIGPMRMLGTSLGMAQRAIASGNRMFEMLDREPEIVTLRRAAAADGNGQVASATSRSASDGPEPALDGVDLAVEGGKVVALVGPTGLGQDEPGRTLARLYDPTAGRSSLDGADLRDVDVASLRRQIAFVADESFLFTATVAENIAYAPDATPRGDRARQPAARRCTTFIERLADGYDTLVGERGLTLSGGQRQRIAIARALLADPRILILDDATSSVDASTEAAIERGARRGDRRAARRSSSPTASDDRARRRDRRARRRPGRRSRHARGAARPLPALPARSPTTASSTGPSWSGEPGGARRGGTAVSDARLLIGAVWKTIRGDDGGGRKVRWLFRLLRPYRVRISAMIVALVLGTAATLAPRSSRV